jgi:hypothetical protein
VTIQVGPNPGWANLGTGNSGFGQNTTRLVRVTQVSRTWVEITRDTPPAIPDICEIPVRSTRASATGGYYNAAVDDAGIFIAGVTRSGLLVFRVNSSGLFVSSYMISGVVNNFS